MPQLNHRRLPGLATALTLAVGVSGLQAQSTRSPAPAPALRTDAIVRVARLRTSAVVSVHTLRQHLVPDEPSVTHVQEGLGSGVVIDTNGLILTNAHVVDGASTIHVLSPDGGDVEASVIGSDPDVDLALIRVADARGLRPAPLGDSSRHREGNVAAPPSRRSSAGMDRRDDSAVRSVPCARARAAPRARPHGGYPGRSSPASRAQRRRHRDGVRGRPLTHGAGFLSAYPKPRTGRGDPFERVAEWTAAYPARRSRPQANTRRSPTAVCPLTLTAAAGFPSSIVTIPQIRAPSDRTASGNVRRSAGTRRTPLGVLLAHLTVSIT